MNTLMAAGRNFALTVLEHTGRRALRIDTGEVVSVLGAPGSGKTRLALELAFLTRPEEGEVLFHGVNPAARRNRLEAKARPREVTLLVQNAEDQLFARSVFDDVAFGPRHLLLPEEEIAARVKSAVRAVGLDPDEVADRSPFALSGGERRRVALAGVLAMEPEVLILDEPTANLDPKTRNEFLKLLEPLRGRSAIIWLTTRVREAQLADRIYLLRDCATVEFPSASSLLRNWRDLARAGVELPAVYDLAEALEERCAQLPSTDDPGEMREAILHLWRESHDR